LHALHALAVTPISHTQLLFCSTPRIIADELQPCYLFREDQQQQISKEMRMSMESAKAFVERMRTDKEFRRRVAEAESTEVRARILKYEGFDFTEEELDSLKDDVKKSILS
jgi:predicted ribosomally synthesized peptide with nif11-like leader